MQERRSPTPAATRKREAIRHLKKALSEDRLELHYQPMARVSDSAVVGVEALLRWRTPDEQDLAALIRSAERSPVIFKLENWILREAFEAAAAWRGSGLHLRVHVNVSAREFPRADLVRRVTRLLQRAGLEPGDVALEITETSWMTEFEAVAEQLLRLRALGIELWLDDFGTGHSSLEWLSHLPVDGLKIAGTFVERLFSEPRCQVIVTRMVELAHDLELRVVAEGVETPLQRDFLATAGCDLLQGFLLHPALPAPELPRVLAAAPAEGVGSRP
jgi:diguanylate cyclase